jgi:glycosyltransferase involved in cell wall biosynthesis
MRIGFLTASVSRAAGGTFEAVRELSRALYHRPELDPRVFGIEDSHTLADLPAWMPVPVRVSSVSGPAAFGYADALSPALHAAELDILHVHGLWMYPSIVARRWGARTGAPYMVSPHGMLDPWALTQGHWKKRIAGALYEHSHLHRAACLHALCESELKAIRAFGLKNPVCVIPNGVELAGRTPSSSASWRAQLPAQAKVLLYLGRLHPKKGLTVLLRGWAKLHREAHEAMKDWYLVIAGWNQGDHREHLESLAGSLGLSASIRFVGPQFGAQKDATFRAADAFVLPSYSEGLPMVVLEAWAHGLPVLMTPQCNLPEGFAAEAAVAIEPDPDSIAAQLRVLFAMSNDRRWTIGYQGVRLIATRFNWITIAAQMESVYRWLLGAGPQPACVRLTEPVSRAS